MAIHSSKYKPRIFPIKGTGSSVEIDRVQSIDPSLSSNKEKVEEVGTPGILGHRKQRESLTYKLMQLEYGSIEFYRALINNNSKGGDGETPITLDDFKTPYFDIAAYTTNDDGAYQGTLLYPALRLSGFTLDLSDPESRVERTFNFVGEQYKLLKEDNKYYIEQVETPEAGSNVAITLDKTAVLDPDNTVYMLRVVRVANDGTTTELTKDTDYTESDANEVVIATVSASDTIKLYYTSSSAPDTIFTTNTSDVDVISTNACSIYLYIPASGIPSSSNYIYRLQSASIDISLDRGDKGELGSNNIVVRNVNDSTVNVSLGSIIDGFTIEEVLRGVSSSYGIIDASKLSDDVSLIVKFFEDDTKQTFKYGIRIDDLTSSDLNAGKIEVNDYQMLDTTLTGESLTITQDVTELGI